MTAEHIRRSDSRADRWDLRTRTLHFDRLPMLMGIVNVTPDSFSDGGSYLDPQRAVDHALGLANDGAAILDIGGESTRPYADQVDEAEELRRVIPVIRALRNQIDVPISIDTSKAGVAEAALDVGAEIINDVTGLEGDVKMLSVASKSGAGLCVMHMQGTPQTMQDAPQYDQVVEEVFAYLQARIKHLETCGVEASRICIDPGIGFGKKTQHNLDLLAGCNAFHELRAPVMIGHSRKGFIGKVLNDMDADREAGTIGVALAMAVQQVQIIRVHQVALVAQALTLFDRAGGLAGDATS